MNVKPGDLAIVVNVKTFPENNGMIVKVVRRYVCTCGCVGWECHSEGRAFVGGLFGGLVVTSGSDAMVEDRNLRPVSGLDVGQDDAEPIAVDQELACL